ELRVQIRLALGLLLELVDRGEVDRAEPLNLALDLLDLLVPRGGVGVGREARDDLLERETGLGKLLRYGFRAYFRLANRKPHGIGRLAQLVDGLVPRSALVLGFAQLVLDFLEGGTRLPEAAFDTEALVETHDELLLVRTQRFGCGLDLAL